MKRENKIKSTVNDLDKQQIWYLCGCDDLGFNR